MKVLTEDMVEKIIQCRREGRALKEISEFLGVDYEFLAGAYREGSSEDSRYHVLYLGLKDALDDFYNVHFRNLKDSDYYLIHAHLLSVCEPDYFNVYYLRKSFNKNEYEIDFDLIDKILSERK